MMFCRDERVGNSSRAGAVLRRPLGRPSRALGLYPIVVEQVLQVLHRKMRRSRSPGTLQSAGDRVLALAGSALVAPTESLLVDRWSRGSSADASGRIGGAMGFTERVAARDQSNSLFVCRGHASKRDSNVLGG